MALAGCSREPIGPPTIGAPTTVVPSAGLPDTVAPQDANNNLDVIRHEGRVYLAFRTAPSHFASPDTVLYVVSSADQQTWRKETELRLGTDIREPRFLSFRGTLQLYFAVLGDNALDFEPGDARRIRLGDDGTWTAPEKFYLDGFIPWRIKIIDDRPYMIGYVGGENIYDTNGEPLTIHLLESDDGFTWRPAVGDDAVVSRGGGSEADFALMDDGSLVAVVRNEAGDELGWGSKICRSERGGLGNWTCKGDRRKYDSPLVFRHRDDVILVGRRSVGNAGLYDLQRTDLSPEEATQFYLLSYSELPKRCAVWRVDPETLTVEHLSDLPSRGDTCFASVLSNEDGGYTLYNYTSPLDGEDLGWLLAQLGTTSIYRLELRWD